MKRSRQPCIPAKQTSRGLLIQQSRGCLLILDRAGLQQEGCTSHRLIRRQPATDHGRFGLHLYVIERYQIRNRMMLKLLYNL